MKSSKRSLRLSICAANYNSQVIRLKCGNFAFKINIMHLFTTSHRIQLNSLACSIISSRPFVMLTLYVYFNVIGNDFVCMWCASVSISFNGIVISDQVKISTCHCRMLIKSLSPIHINGIILIFPPAVRRSPPPNFSRAQTQKFQIQIQRYTHSAH